MQVLLKSEEGDGVIESGRQVPQPHRIGLDIPQPDRPGHRRDVHQPVTVAGEPDQPAAPVGRVGVDADQAAGGQPVQELAESGRVHDQPLSHVGEGDSVPVAGPLVDQPQDGQLRAGHAVLPSQDLVEPGNRLVKPGPRADRGDRLGTHAIIMCPIAILIN
jgi:hypothetical protein